MNWFEAEPTTSLSLIPSIAPGGRGIDVGGGASVLVDCVVAAETWEVTVLDVSATSLELAQTRLHEQAHRGAQLVPYGTPVLNTLSQNDLCPGHGTWPYPGQWRRRDTNKAFSDLDQCLCNAATLLVQSLLVALV